MPRGNSIGEMWVAFSIDSGYEQMVMVHSDEVGDNFQPLIAFSLDDLPEVIALAQRISQKFDREVFIRHFKPGCVMMRFAPETKEATNGE